MPVLKELEIGTFYRTMYNQAEGDCAGDYVYLAVEGVHPVNIKFYGKIKKGIFLLETGHRFIYGQGNTNLLVKCTPEELEQITLALL